MIKPKIIFIDWHNTLCDYKFFWHLEKSNKKKDVELFNLITDRLFVRNSNSCLIPEWLRGKFTSEQVFKDLANNLKVDYDHIFNEFAISCKSMKLISPNIVPLINEVKRHGVKCYLATDNMDSFEKWVVPELKLDKIFNGILNSYNLGVVKMDIDKNGDSLFFKNILDNKKINPNRTILFDDSEDKENRLNKYGINYIRIDKTNDLESNLRKLLCEGNDYCSKNY